MRGRGIGKGPVALALVFPVLALVLALGVPRGATAQLAPGEAALGPRRLAAPAAGYTAQAGRSAAERFPARPSDDPRGRSAWVFPGVGAGIGALAAAGAVTAFFRSAEDPVAHPGAVYLYYGVQGAAVGAVAGWIVDWILE